MQDTVPALIFLALYPIFGASLMGLLLQSQNGGAYFGHVKKVYCDLRLLWDYCYILVGFLAAGAIGGRVGYPLFYVAGLIFTALYQLGWQENSRWYQAHIEPDANARLSMTAAPFVWPVVLPIMHVGKRVEPDLATTD